MFGTQDSRRKYAYEVLCLLKQIYIIIRIIKTQKIHSQNLTGVLKYAIIILNKYNNTSFGSLKKIHRL